MWQPSPSSLDQMQVDRRRQRLGRQPRRWLLQSWELLPQSRSQAGLDLQPLVELINFCNQHMYLYFRWLVALLLKVVLALVAPTLGLVA